MPGERVVQEEEEPASRRQHVADLRERVVDRLDVLEHQARENQIERRARERHRRVAPQVLDTTTSSARLDDLRFGRIDADDEAVLHGNDASELSLARADVEHSSRVTEVLPQQRDDLFLVFGIGAGGEVLLPPRGVGLPGVGHELTPARGSARGSRPRISARNRPV